MTNLRIERLERRDDSSVDVMGCQRQRAIEIRKVEPTEDYRAALAAVGHVYGQLLVRLRGEGLVSEVEPERVRRPPSPARRFACFA